MSDKTKAQLTGENQSSFPNNNAGAITAEALRNFNQDIIDSVALDVSASFTGGITVEGNVTASAFVGDGSGLTNLPIEPLPQNIVSGSSQIDYPQISNIPSGIVSGSSQLTASYDVRYQLSGSDTPLPSGVVSGSSQIDYPLISNIPSGIVSSSSQVIDILVPLNAYTESNDTKWNTLGTQTGSYVEESETGSFAKTNVNNTFGGDQTFNSINAVSASIGHLNYVTGSATIIGDAFIVLNADTPTLPFAGIKVFDSGSATTASFEWNGESDFWTVVEEGGLSANLITGPLGVKGAEALLTTNVIPRLGIENQLLDSNISDDGTTITLDSDTNVTGTISATTFSGMISGSSQVSYPDLSNIPSGIISSSEQLPSGLVSGSSQIDVTQTTNIATLATTGSNTFNGNQFINGSSTFNDNQIVNGSSTFNGNHIVNGPSTFNGNQIVNGNIKVDSYAVNKTGAVEFRYNNPSGSSTSFRMGADDFNNAQSKYAVNGDIIHFGTGISTNIGFGNNTETQRIEFSVSGSQAALLIKPTDITILKPLVASGSVDIEGNLTASLQEGYVWVGDNNGRTITAATSSFARTDVDNNFSGNQNFVDISVSGTGSFAHIDYVTGSATIIGDAFIVLNADTPTLPFAGIKVFDTGSASTASFEWNGDTDTWIVVKESELSANLITAPIGTKGSEATLTDNSIPKSGTENTLQNSNITDDGTTITLGSNTNVTGVLSGDGSGLTNIPTGDSFPYTGSAVISGSLTLETLNYPGFLIVNPSNSNNYIQIGPEDGNAYTKNTFNMGAERNFFQSPGDILFNTDWDAGSSGSLEFISSNLVRFSAENNINVSSSAGNIDLIGQGLNLTANNGNVQVNGNVNLPYNNGVKQLYVGLSGSAQAQLGGFDYEGKAYGSFSTNGSGGFNLQDNFEGTGSQIYIRSENGNINISAKTNVSLNSDDGNIYINGNVTLPYDNGVKNLNIGLSGSAQAQLGGFDHEGKAYGYVSGNGSGGFAVVDNFEGTGSNLQLHSHSGSIDIKSFIGNINLKGKTNVGINSDSGSILLETKSTGIVRMRQKNKTLTLGSSGIYIGNTFGGAGEDFQAGIDIYYGLNLYNSTKDVGWTLDLNTVTETGNTNSGLYANYGAFVADLISFQDSSNYTDGAITVHQILNTEDINVTGSLDVSGSSTFNGNQIVNGNIDVESREVNKTGAVEFAYYNPSGSSTSFRMGADDFNNAQSKFEAQGDIIQFGTIISTNIGFGNDTETQRIEFSASGSNGALTIEPTEITMGEQLVLSNYASLDFADDAAASAGGVPLGGIYRTTGDIKIRIT